MIEYNKLGKNYYEKIGVSKNATEEQITDALDVLQSRYVSDSVVSSQLNSIRDTLCDKQNRRNYDKRISTEIAIPSNDGTYRFVNHNNRIENHNNESHQPTIAEQQVNKKTMKISDKLRKFLKKHKGKLIALAIGLSVFAGLKSCQKNTTDELVPTEPTKVIENDTDENKNDKTDDAILNLTKQYIEAIKLGVLADGVEASTEDIEKLYSELNKDGSLENMNFEDVVNSIKQELMIHQIKESLKEHGLTLSNDQIIDIINEHLKENKGKFDKESIVDQYLRNRLKTLSKEILNDRYDSIDEKLLDSIIKENKTENDIKTDVKNVVDKYEKQISNNKLTANTIYEMTEKIYQNNQEKGFNVDKSIIRDSVVITNISNLPNEEFDKIYENHDIETIRNCRRNLKEYCDNVRNYNPTVDNIDKCILLSDLVFDSKEYDSLAYEAIKEMQGYELAALNKKINGCDDEESIQQINQNCEIVVLKLNEQKYLRETDNYNKSTLEAGYEFVYDFLGKNTLLNFYLTGKLNDENSINANTTQRNLTFAEANGEIDNSYSSCKTK